MKDLVFEFIDFDTPACFKNFGELLGGVKQKDAIVFNSSVASGELINKSLADGLSVRKFRFTTLENLRFQKKPAAKESPKKFVLLYVLHPVTFLLKNQKKKLRVNGSRNNMFLTNDMGIEFRVNAKQPFYIFEISMTESWLREQFTDADPLLKETIDQYISDNSQKLVVEPLTIDEHKTLHDLQVAMISDKEDELFIRARSYNMICNFFGKLMNRANTEVTQSGMYYDQIIQAEKMVLNDLRKPPKIESIAKNVNMSVPSLVRKFKMIYGKSINEYYVEMKMKTARQMILEKKMSVTEMARALGYNQPSAFIETFSKKYGYSPGILKIVSNQFMFF
jgi:AraC-like DNA-binding protein